VSDEPVRIVVEIPEVPLRSLGKNPAPVEKIEELQELLDNSTITFNKNLNQKD
jgi:hypothetical protein